MPSPGSRVGLERALRVVAIASIGAMLLEAARPPRAASGDAPARWSGEGELASALPQWTLAGRPVDLAFSRAPSPADRAWLRAHALGVAPVRWRIADGAVPAAMAVEPIADPAGGARVLVAAPSGAVARLVDDAGALDSVRAEGGGAWLAVSSIAGTARAELGAVAPAARLRDSLVLRPVLLIAEAGWEGKFTAAALEERGWRVATRMRIAPQATVAQGSVEPIDTSRFSAVVALDASAAPSAARIAAYARSGGGVVLGAAAAREPAFSALAAAASGTRIAADDDRVRTSDARAGLPATTLVSLRPGAVPVERRGERTMVAARRLALGRVVQVGYEDTWRWRMEGGDEGPSAHRRWWGSLVASVAYAPRVALDVPTADQAPIAALHDALGAPSPASSSPAADPDAPWRRWLPFALFLLAALGEWSSRRLRGAR